MTGSQPRNGGRRYFGAAVFVWVSLLAVILAVFSGSGLTQARAERLAPGSTLGPTLSIERNPEIVLSAGGQHTCGLKPDGSIECWGDNSRGQATGQTGPFIQVTAGGLHTCGLRPDGSVDCWGWDKYAQNADQDGPYIQIDAGNHHTCGLKDDGRVECWGMNESGQAEGQTGPFRQFSPGYSSTFGLRPDGSVDCWGHHYDRWDRPGPYLQVSAGWAHACALTAAGDIECWGNDNYGVVQNQTGPFTQISSNTYVSCGLRANGKVDCWGDNKHGAATDWDGPFTQVSVGWYHACGLRPDGSVMCWGNSYWGQGADQEGPFGTYQQPPVAADDEFAVIEEVPLDVDAPGVLANDSSPNGSPLTAVLYTDVSHGDLALSPNGAFSYLPEHNFSGVDSFTYTARSGQVNSTVATVRIAVSNTNDPPVVSDVAITIDENTVATIKLSGNDPDGDHLDYAIVDDAKHGELAGTGQDIVYTPNLNYFGSDSFTFRANDGASDSNVATVRITINPILNHDTWGSWSPPPANLPASSDSLFHIDSHPQLDSYRYRHQGPIEFTIEVDRVVGRTYTSGLLIQPQKLIDQGIVSPKVTLWIHAFDVDADYSGTDVAAESDKVYLNGVEIGTLKGSNGKWSITRFDVDVRHFRFGIPLCHEYDGRDLPADLSACNISPRPVQNEIRIEVDADNPAGWTWALGVDWAAVSFDAARPILFVHGIGGSDDSGACTTPNSGLGCIYWDYIDNKYYFGFRPILYRAGFLTVTTENFLGGWDGVYDNAYSLYLLSDDIRRRYGVDKFTIVAHSKGGLDSRGFLTWFNMDDSVDTLITLATPHHGSILSDFTNGVPAMALKKLGFERSEGLRNLSETYANSVFNVQASAAPGVRYYAVFASAGKLCKFLWWSWICADNDQQNAVPKDMSGGEGLAFQLLLNNGTQQGVNDFLVTVPSARLIGIPGHTSRNTTEFGPYFLNHFSIRAALALTNQQDTRITDLVHDLLRVQPQTVARNAPLLADYTAESAAAPDASGMEVHSGAIGEAEALSQTIGVDTPSEVEFFLLWDSGDLSLSLIDPDGRIITPATEDDQIVYAENRSGEDVDTLFVSGKWASYHIVAPKKGIWKAQMNAAAQLPENNTDWVMMVSQEGDIALSITPQKPWQALNEPIIFTSLVKAGGAPFPNAAVTASIILPDESVQTLPLLDDGAHNDGAAADGVYGASIMGRQFGIYRLSATATGVWHGVPFSRTAVNELQVASGSAAISGAFSDQGIDTSGDGRLDIIRVNVPVNVVTSGEYSAFAELQSSAGVVVARTTATAALTPGQRTLALDFDAEELWSNGATGRFKVVNLTLMDMRGYDVPIQIDLKPFPYTTRSYNSDDLQHPNIYLTGESNDHGVDTNGNAKFDELVIDVGLLLESGGDYAYEATLVDASGVHLGQFGASLALAPGANSLTFRFDGNAIGANGQNGPYFLVDFKLWGDGGLLSELEIAATHAYDFHLFESAPFRADLFLPLQVR